MCNYGKCEGGELKFGNGNLKFRKIDALIKTDIQTNTHGSD